MKTCTLSAKAKKSGSRSKSGDKILDELMAYQNEGVILKLTKKLGVTIEEARRIFDDTKRFLFICGTCPGNWGPTLIIDEGWHEFVLFTKDYADFCERFFGKFVHHVPNNPSKPSPKDKKRPYRTLVAAIQIFGKESLSENWIYRDKDGNPTLGPKMDLPKVEVTALDPCSDGGNSCGCNACDSSTD